MHVRERRVVWALLESSLDQIDQIKRVSTAISRTMATSSHGSTRNHPSAKPNPARVRLRVQTFEELGLARYCLFWSGFLFVPGIRLGKSRVLVARSVVTYQTSFSTRRTYQGLSKV